MVKLRKHSSPAFRPGEVWVGASGIKVVVVKTFKDRVETDCLSDWNVTYLTGEGLKTHTKDCWSFQCRYTHISDMKEKKDKTTN